MRITRLKSQISIEFIAVIGTLLMLFIVIFYFSFRTQQDSETLKGFMEKRNECLRLSGILSSVSDAGNKATVRTSTTYAIILYNDSITVKNVVNITTFETRIAILASEAGESSQDFYDTATAQLNPAWYKVCFTDISGAACEQWQGNGMTVATWDSINQTLDDLMQDIWNYNVTYLEDPHIQYNAQYNGQNYTQIIEDWVKAGNILITAEHFMCREQGSGSYSSTSYRCNPPGSNSDVWAFFGNKLHQQAGSFGNNVTIIIAPPEEIFPNVNKGDNYDFEEDSFINFSSTTYQEPNAGNLSGTYSDSGGTYAGAITDNNVYWYVGSDNDAYNTSAFIDITFNLSNLTIGGADLTSLNFSLKYCHDGSTGSAACDGDAAEGAVEGSQDVQIYNYSANAWVDIGDLRTNDAGNEVFSSYTAYGTLSHYMSSKKEIRVRYEIDYYNANSQDSYLVIDRASLNITANGLNIQTIVGTYDANSRAAIVYFDYGSGKVFYFADFQVEPATQTQYSAILSDLIEKVYYLLINPKNDEVSCPYTAALQSIGEFTGDIEIKNLDGSVYLTQL